ncbi:hypothetical protein IFM89_019948 [Coptis chinensis]|uniref:C2H2-type domain-containing protein n=1 Tax=Coptis chinensis TaxID=261450 RepID=A0A835LJW8_9MAGN|nr:hypothetical protein IFM89_019948 [Coptis chinensis]
MEQADYWMWMRKKLSEKSHVQVSSRAAYNDSWEEQAFAEDSAGPLGGCIWPPRSYSCSFCRREFRSAQALGGHMNVHRRDRARLKQSPNSQIESSTLGVQFPPQVCSLVFSPNPNSNSNILAPAISASRVPAPTSTLDKCNDQTLVKSPSYSSTKVHELQMGSLFSSPATHTDSIAIKVINQSDKYKLEAENNLRGQEIGLGVCREDLKPDSEVSLNMVTSRTRPTRSGGDNEDEVISSKRRKIGANSLPFFLKPTGTLVETFRIQPEFIGLSPSSIEEIDLELRLGDRPKVK